MLFKTKTQVLALLIVLSSNGINYTFLKPLEDIRFHLPFNFKTYGLPQINDANRETFSSKQL